MIPEKDARALLEEADGLAGSLNGRIAELQRRGLVEKAALPDGWHRVEHSESRTVCARYRRGEHWYANETLTAVCVHNDKWRSLGLLVPAAQADRRITREEADAALRGWGGLISHLEQRYRDSAAEALTAAGAFRGTAEPEKL